MPPSSSKTADRFHRLTLREREVLRLVAEGLTSRGIAERLGIRPRTVDAHRANIRHKLMLHGPADLIRVAFERGLVSPDRVRTGVS